MNIWLILRQIHCDIPNVYFISINQIHMGRQARTEGKILGLSVASAPGSPICLHKWSSILGMQVGQVRHHVRPLADQGEASSAFQSTEGSANSKSLPEDSALCCPAPPWEGWGQSCQTGPVKRATTQCRKASPSIIAAERTLGGPCLIWFVPLHGLSLTDGNSRNSKHFEANYFKA